MQAYSLAGRHLCQVFLLSTYDVLHVGNLTLEFSAQHFSVMQPLNITDTLILDNTVDYYMIIRVQSNLAKSCIAIPHLSPLNAENTTH